MAEKEQKKDEKPAEHAPAAAKEGKKGSLLSSTPVLLGVVMLIEGGLLFAGFKFLGGGPKSSEGAIPALEAPKGEGEAEPAAHGGGEEGTAVAAPAKIDPKKLIEIPVLEFKAPNRVSGSTFLYEVAIVVRARVANQKKLAEAITERSAMVKDRVRTIISQMDPAKLGGQEAGLETLKRQIKFQLDEIVGEGMVEEVLIPRCIPFRTDF